MRWTFWGGVRTVTGSRHLLESGGKRFMMDCGLYQGKRSEAEKLNRELPFDIDSLDAVMLGHAHIDHSGNLPSLYKNGFHGTIHATKPSDDLCHYMLPDSAYLQERDVAIVNRKHERKGLPPVEPIYAIPDAMETIRLFEPHPYDKWFEISDTTRVKFIEAGHILGAALTVIEERINGKKTRILYAVDLGRKGLPLLKNPVHEENVDYLVIESTYGNRVHENIDKAKDFLRDVVKKTFERGGKIIIPSFAVERAQEIIYYLHQLSIEGALPEVPIYIDSPLAINVTDVFRRNLDVLDKGVQKMLTEVDDPFGFQKLHYVRSVEESKVLNIEKRPMIIISASGMAEGGRILHHLEHNISNPKNTIMIVGFMAENTLGRRIADHEKTVRIFGETHTVKADVVVANTFSAHADRDELIDYVSRTQKHGRLKKVFIVHGEEVQSLEFALSVKDLGIKDVYVPHIGDSVILD